MPELSLAALTEKERPGIAVVSLEFRRLTKDPTPQEAIVAAGLAPLTAGRVFGLPSELAVGKTILSVEFTRETPGPSSDDAQEQWVASWDELSQEGVDTVPPTVREKSAALGGSAGLLNKLNGLWQLHTNENSWSILVAEYEITGRTTKMLPARSRKLGRSKGFLAGISWDIEEADVLLAASMRLTGKTVKERRAKEPEFSLVVVGRFDDLGGPIDVISLEQRVWQDVLINLLEPTA